VSIRVHDQPAIVVEVQAELYADSASQADADAGRIERGISQEANRVSVVAPDLPRPEWFFFGRGPKIDYEILVPADTEVRANCRNGSVYISGTRRRARVESRNGKVTIENIAGDVEVEAKNGRITLESCASAKVIGVNGPISLERVRGQIDVETRNGPIEMVDAGATVRARTTNGSVRFTGRVNGDIDMQAANGTIRLSVPVDSRFEIDAESVHGTTRSDLPVKEHRDSEATGPAPKVKLRTTNGSIRITGA
jgi:DUF4097 and DUF4098 domain-containing protein YvlB